MDVDPRAFSVIVKSSRTFVCLKLYSPLHCAVLCPTSVSKVLVTSVVRSSLVAVFSPVWVCTIVFPFKLICTQHLTAAAKLQTGSKL